MEYRIQEVSGKLEVPRSTIRYWEREFPELLTPHRTSGGQRRYSEDDIACLIQVRDLLHIKNKTIKEAKEVLENKNPQITTDVHWKEKSILVTGGTGSFGRHFCKEMSARYHPKVIRIYSRDEIKQHEMRRQFNQEDIRYFIGDVRDLNRLRRAMEGVDIVVHAAAMNHVESCEYNPLEAVKTNIIGANNVIDAAIDVGVQKVMAISTDKAVYPVNMYGATALCSEKIFVQGNMYSGPRATRFSCFRCGNFISSRKALASLFGDRERERSVVIMDKRMSRFWLTMDQGIELLIKSIHVMEGGEVFVPRMPSIRITDFARAIAPECKIYFAGIRNEERIHEVLISEEDGRNTIQQNGIYIILPDYRPYDERIPLKGTRVADGFMYTSETNEQWLSFEELKRLLPDAYQ